MRKLLTILAVATALGSSAQEKPKTDYKESAEKAKVATDKEFKIVDNSKHFAVVKGDTLTISEATKYIVIKDRIYPIAAFTQSVPVFLTADAWLAVLDIINTREYGKIAATTISQIIQSIGQQLPRKDN